MLRIRLYISKLLLSHDAIKLLKSEKLIGLRLIQNMCVMHHLLNLRLTHSFSQFPTHLLYLLKINRSRLFRIVQRKNLQQTFFRSSITQLAVNNLQKIIEIYLLTLSLQILNHLKNRFISFIQSKLLQNLLNFNWIDKSRSFLIEKIKSALEVIELIL